jgi:hypothetical protein
MKSRGLLYGLAGATGLGCLFAASTASAQAQNGTFGAPYSWAIVAEDMTGYFSEHRTYRAQPPVLPQFPDGPETTVGRSEFSLAFRDGARVGVHFFILPSLSVGGTIGYESRSSNDTHEDTPGTWTHDSPSESSFVFVPKAGYALMLTPAYGFWFRAGVGHRVDTQVARFGEDKYKDSAWFVTGDILFVAAPIPHLGFYVGPTGDIGFLGWHSEDHPEPPGALPNSRDWSVKESYNRLGATVGLIGHFQVW